ncbi:MAG: RNase adapter RapZ [Proteobacteria bacterium]|nr:RNase adapter RapZ [Pseudomonadota bacterium]
MTKKTILLVSGLSGAGKTTALKTLEDMGYECIDNMPLRLLPAMLSDTSALPERLALGVDSRNRDLKTHVEAALDALSNLKGVGSHILYLLADEEVLVRRFNETRRRHPLLPSRPVRESLALERQLLAPIQQHADSMIDTSGFKPGDLKKYLERQFEAGNKGRMAVFFMSFGFKHGLPKEADMVFDVRFLRNPHWDDDLRPKTGKEADVQAYIREDENFEKAFTQLRELVATQLPLFAASGKTYMTVAFGCTGGQHRSVMMTELMGRALTDTDHGFDVQIHHRDL